MNGIFLALPYPKSIKIIFIWIIILKSITLKFKFLLENFIVFERNDAPFVASMADLNSL